MNIEFTAHLRARMRQRRIAEWQIRNALDSPIATHQTPEGSLCYVAAFDRGRILKVWVVHPPPSPGRLVVKSAAWKGESDG